MKRRKKKRKIKVKRKQGGPDFSTLCIGGFVGFVVGFNDLMNFINDYRQAK